MLRSGALRFTRGNEEGRSPLLKLDHPLQELQCQQNHQGGQVKPADRWHHRPHFVEHGLSHRTQPLQERMTRVGGNPGHDDRGEHDV